MLFKVTILGSGTCAVTKERSCSSYALQIGEQFFLLDIGFGSSRRLAEAGLNYRAIRRRGDQPSSSRPCR
jgi:ribonuclease BN (tRNA processing enzyme)